MVPEAGFSEGVQNRVIASDFQLVKHHFFFDYAQKSRSQKKQFLAYKQHLRSRATSTL
jgi:hypothetical protein